MNPPRLFENRFIRGALELLLILVAGLFIYGWKLGDAPLDRTEPHRALVGHQMVTSGQWFIPKLFGEIYLRKPPLIYWIEATAEKLAGHGNEFVWRLPSAIGSALLAVILAAWSARWFGPFARLPAGIACLALIPLWEQDRGADIDALNTVASVITAMVVLELTASSPGTPGDRRRELDSERKQSSEEPRQSGVIKPIWIIALSLWLAVTLLLKGPGGFPPILGALIGPSILLRDWKWVRRPGIWVGILVGTAIFASYGIAAKIVLHHQGVPTDNGGLREAMQRLVIHKPSQILPAILAPLTTLLYGVPISIAIVFSLILVRPGPPKPVSEVPRRAGSNVDEPGSSDYPRTGVTGHFEVMKPLPEGKVIALLGTVAAAFVIWIFAGNDNPRYEYVALPLLAPLVGAVGVAWRENEFAQIQLNIMRILLAAFGGLWSALAVVLTVIIWKRTSDHAVLGAMAALALIAGTVAVIAWLSSRYRLGSIAIILVLITLAVPLGERKNLERQKKSARAVAAQLRQVTGGQPIGIVSMNRDMPEMFYYANLPVHAYGERGLDKLAAVPGGQWVVLSQNKTFPEYSTLVSQIHTAFPFGVTRLKMPSDQDTVYVGWYNPPPGVSRVVKPPAVSAFGDQSDED